MNDFNERFVEAFKQAGLSVRDEETGKDLNQAEFLDYLNQHTLYEIDGTWYTRDSVFSYGNMEDAFERKFQGNTMVAEEIAFYMLNDCPVSGLCIIKAERKYGIFPLIERTGDQSGIWSCKDYPFIYDDVKVFVDWNKWDDFGYVAAKKGSAWGVFKVIQFPDPATEQVADFIYSSPTAAMKIVGITALPRLSPFMKKVL